MSAATKTVAAKEITATLPCCQATLKENAAKAISTKEVAAKPPCCQTTLKAVVAKPPCCLATLKENAAKEMSTKDVAAKPPCCQISLKEVAAKEFVKPKVVEKVFDLPIVIDTYGSLAKLTTPLQPYVEKAGSIASPVIDCAFTVRDSIEGKMPEMIQSGFISAKGQAVAAAASVDATLCSGIDSLVDKVPVLKQATPALYNSTKEGVTSYATLAATYAASYTLAHVFLKASDLGLETADSLLKWTSSEKVEPVMMGLRRVRSEVSIVRKEGVVRNGTEKAKVLEEASLIWAMVEMAGLAPYYNYFLSNEVQQGVGAAAKEYVKTGSK